MNITSIQQLNTTESKKNLWVLDSMEIETGTRKKTQQRQQTQTLKFHFICESNWDLDFVAPHRTNGQPITAIENRTCGT